MGSLLDRFSRRSREESHPVDPSEADVEQLVGKDGLESIVRSITEPSDQDPLLGEFDGSLHEVGPDEKDEEGSESPPDEEEVQPVEQVELVDEILSQPLTRESCDKLAQHGIFLVCSPKDIDLSDVPEEQEVSPYDDPPDIPTSEDMDLSDSSDEEEVSPYTENDDAEDAEDAEDDADNAARSEETAAFARDAADFLKERGASRELINWFFEAVGPGQFREALEVAERLYGLFGNEAEAAENYGRGLLPCQECGEGGVPWFVAKRLLRSVGLESANPFTTREEARRGWRILHGAKAALMHQLVQPTPDLPDNVGYIVGPEDEDPEA